MTQLAETEDKLKMNIYLLTLYLNNFYESKLMFKRTLRKLFFIFSAVKNLRTSTYLFHKSTAPANIKSAAFGTVL